MTLLTPLKRLKALKTLALLFSLGVPQLGVGAESPSTSILRHQLKAKTENLTPSSDMPVFSRMVFRGSYDALNQNQRYRLRLIPRGWGESSAREQGRTALRKLQLAEEQVEKLKVLRAKYGLVLKHLFQLREKTLLDQLAILKSRRVKLVQAQLKGKKPNLSTLVEAQDKALSAQAKLESSIDELDSTVNQLVSLYEIKQNELPSEDWALPGPDLILKRLSSSSTPAPSSSPEVQEGEAKLGFLNSQVELAESEDRKWIDYVDFGMRVNQNGQTAMVAELAVPIPLLKSLESANHPSVLRKKKEALREEAQLQTLLRVSNFETTDLFFRTKSLGERLSRRKKSEELKNSQMVLKLLQPRLPEGLEDYLRVEERIIEARRDLNHLEEAFFKTYLDFEEKTGRMIGTPLVNLLSEHLDPLDPKS